MDQAGPSGAAAGAYWPGPGEMSEGPCRNINRMLERGGGKCRENLSTVH